MSRRQSTEAASLLTTPPLLITEAADEFDRIHRALNREIKPRGIIEKMYVGDIVYFIWQIRRLRRCKDGVINSELRAALISLFIKLLRKPGQYPHEVKQEAEELAHAWFIDPSAKKRISELLGQFQLDESAIEIESIRRSFADLERLDRLLASLESRRNKALRCIAEYRDDLARRLRESSDRIIEEKRLALEDRRGKNPPVG